MAAQKLGVKATIVMPRTTPRIKVDAVRSRGARVVLHGDTYDDAADHARKLVEEQGMTYMHPFDDPDVIAGQGTVGMEMLRQHPARSMRSLSRSAAVVYVPDRRLRQICAPTVNVFAVESEDAACLQCRDEAGDVCG